MPTIAERLSPYSLAANHSPNNKRIQPTSKKILSVVDFSERTPMKGLPPVRTSLPVITKQFGPGIAENVKLHLNLELWCQKMKGTSEYDTRLKVSEKIKKCYTSKDPQLDLSNYKRLTSLPNAIGYLTMLTELKLSDCQRLRYLPDTIGHLTMLTELNLSNCENLISLPDTIGHLTMLTELNLFQCERLSSLPVQIKHLVRLIKLNLFACVDLKSLPVEIGYLVSLREIDLTYCEKISSLPVEIGYLIKLTKLNLHGCSQLRSLPVQIGDLINLIRLDLSQCSRLISIPNCLARLPNHCEINTEHCALNAQASLAFQDALTQARRENPNQGPIWSNTVYEPPLPTTMTFSETFALYSGLIQKTFPSEDLSIVSKGFIEPLTEDEKNLLNQFLKKVTTTADFNTPRTQGGVLFTILQSFKQCLKTPAFKENLFVLINDALDSCSDRTAITLNRIEVERRLLSPHLISDLNHLAHFLITYRRLQHVVEESIKIVQEKNLGDAIEPMLYLQIMLKELLNLPIATEGMLYPGIAKISDPEMKEIGCKIMSQTNTHKQQQDILCKALETRYDEKGKPIAIGPFSITNPFQIPIHEIWQKELAKKHPKEFKEIEPPVEDKNLREYFSKEEHLQYENLPSEAQKIAFVTKIHAKKITELVIKLTNLHLS